MKDITIVISEQASEYFEEKGITSKEWIKYCQETYKLESGDVVFYEGSNIGYIKKT